MGGEPRPCNLAVINAPPAISYARTSLTKAVLVHGMGRDLLSPVRAINGCAKKTHV